MSKNRFVCTACVSSHLISFLAHRYTKTLCAFPFFAWCLIFNDTHPTRITAFAASSRFFCLCSVGLVVVFSILPSLFSRSFLFFKAAVCFCKTSLDFFCFWFFFLLFSSFFVFYAKRKTYVCVSSASDLTCPWAVSFSVLKIKCVCYEKPHKRYWYFTE